MPSLRYEVGRICKYDSGLSENTQKALLMWEKFV